MKKKLNRKPVYKKGGESWVSDKMNNLPMYQMGTQATLPNTLGFNQSSMNLQPQLNKLDPNSLNYGETWANNNPLPQMGTNSFSYNPNFVEDLNNNPSDILSQNQEQYSYNNTINEDETQSEQFFNPYGGINLESRLAYGANQLGKGNTAQGILGLASGALGAVRTGVGAYAAGNREKYIMNEYNDKVNKAMTPRTMSLEEGGMIDFMQNGGYNYAPTGDRRINTMDAQKINQSTGIQFTPDFAQSYFSQQVPPQTQTPPQVPRKSTNVLDITSDGQFTDRKVWRNQKPEWYVGKKVAVEGVDYDRIPYKQWESYKMTPEYSSFQNQNIDSRIAEYQKGGKKEVPSEDVVNNLQRGMDFAQMAAKYIGSRGALNKVPGGVGSAFGILDAFQNSKNMNPADVIGLIPFVPAQILSETIDQGIRQKKLMEDYAKKAKKNNLNIQLKDNSYTIKDTTLDTNKYQEGGQTGQDQVMQIIQMYAQMAQQDPQTIMEQLQQMSPEEQQMAIQEMAQAVQQPQQEQQFQKGGEFVKKLTGEYTTPLDENDPTINAEVEQGEYLQSPDGEISKALGETHEAGGTKVNLEGGTRIVSDHLKLGGINAKHYKENFDLEVKATDTYAKVLDKFTQKSGLQKIVDEQEKVIEQLKKSEESAQGSSVSESTNNLNKMFLSEKLAELEQEKAPLLEARKSLMEDVFNRQEASKPVEESSEEQYEKGGEVPQYQRGDLTPYQGEGSFSLDNLENFYRQSRGLGYTGKKQIGDIQQWMAKNYPEEVVNYFTKSGQPLTAKHVDLIKSNSRDVFAKTGISPNKTSADYTSEEKVALQNALGERANKEFYLQGFTDNKWDWRAPVMGVPPLAPAGLNAQKISAPQLPNFYREPEKSPILEDTEVGKIKDKQEDTRKSLNLMSLPNQAPMMPDSLEGALKVTRRYDRVNPMQLSPEQQIGAIKGQEAQAIEQINQLPESQRAGALANLSAITQENLAKVYSDINRANLASDNQAQQFNAQTQAQEENARASDLQSYENKIMRAKATTDSDRRGYYNQLEAVNLANYNAVNNVNLLNQMYDNYGYNGSSVEQTQGAPKWNASQATANGIPITNTKKKTTKKRFGGKI
jgi:hypothetical protein